MIYISRCYRNLTSAGNKAKTDNEVTMQEMGFVNVGLPQKINDNKVIIFFYNLIGVIKACLSMRRNDILVLQYPVKKYFSLLCNVAHHRGVKVIALIHDLGSFRRKKITVEREIWRLSHADCIIASNEVMEQWLKEQGLKKPITYLGMWDYRSSSPVGGRQYHYDVESKSIVYAGSLKLRKNSFFMKLPPIIHGFKTYVYGKDDEMPSLKENQHIIFHDFTPADDFIAHCEGDFGLVWDGDSLDACTGDFGSYLQYNTPHKVSFYLRAGLPVIVWKKSAMASIIEKLGIGLTINSLSELSYCLDKVSSEEYNSMKQRVLNIAEKMNHGGFVKDAVERALKLL